MSEVGGDISVPISAMTGLRVGGQCSDFGRGRAVLGSDLIAPDHLGVRMSMADG